MLRNKVIRDEFGAKGITYAVIISKGGKVIELEPPDEDAEDTLWGVVTSGVKIPEDAAGYLISKSDTVLVRVLEEYNGVDEPEGYEQVHYDNDLAQALKGWAVRYSAEPQYELVAWWNKEYKE